MEAGQLRHQVTIQQRQTTQDEYGAQSTAWADVKTVWAAVEPLNGRELLSAQTVHSETDTRITVRYTSISTANRIVFEGVVYDILNVIDPEQRHKQLQMLCKSGADNG